MRKQTDLKSIKRIAINFLYIEPSISEEIPLFIQHPYFETRILINPEDQSLFDIFEDKEKYKRLLNFMKKEILNGKNSLFKTFLKIRKSYRCTFFKYVNEYMNEKDFSEMLMFCWISNEMPSSDVNVSKKDFVKWFKFANKKYMMDDDDFTLYNNFSKKIMIYRGCQEEETEHGISWTSDKNQAIWFSKRYNGEGYIYSAKINKEDILCFTNKRNEHEIIINPTILENIQLEKIN